MKKSATQLQTRSTNIYPPDQTGAETQDSSGATRMGNNQDIAELVWKHSREHIPKHFRKPSRR
jgi:hypothetical protein